MDKIEKIEIIEEKGRVVFETYNPYESEFKRADNIESRQRMLALKLNQILQAINPKPKE